MIRRALLAGAAACGLGVVSPVARAEVTPVAATKGEARVTVVAFDPDQIVRVRVPEGGVQVVFSPDETQFDVGLVGSWVWDRSQNTLFFLAGPDPKPKIVYVVSALPGGETRRYQIELVPAGGGANGAAPWQRPPGALEVRATAGMGGDATASDVLPDGPLPRDVPAAAARDVPPAVVRFTYAKQEAEAKATAARKRREDAARAWRLANPGAARETRASRAERMEQERLRAEVAAAAQATAARKRCNVMGRGETRLIPRAVCNHGSYTTFAYSGMAVPALFGVGPDGEDVKVQQEPVPGQPGLVVARATFEFWRARAGGVQVAEFWDASYDPVGIPTTGTDTASPYVRMAVPDAAVRRVGATGAPMAGGYQSAPVVPPYADAPPPLSTQAAPQVARERAVMEQASRELRELQARLGTMSPGAGETGQLPRPIRGGTAP